MAALVAIGGVGIVPAGARAAGPEVLVDEPVSFLRQVRPLLSDRCFRCHGPDPETREADLRLDTREGMAATASSGRAVVAPGEPEASELYLRVTTTHEDERMPPAGGPPVLSAAEQEAIRAWIAAGAPWQDHWAYLPPRRAPLPDLPPEPWSVHPVDRWLVEAWRRHAIVPAEPADPVTLVRRLSFDLTGLPPEPAVVEGFAAAPTAEALGQLVERLLASPHYGERMAVYWLDLVRYADSCGYHSDVDQPIAPYRDYVIQAFNDNLPFDRFTREQLAGDLLAEPTLAQRVASGYNRLNKTTEEGGAQPGEYLAKSAADRVRTTTGVWLASTFGCAECHDHKYDPFTTRDFYSLAALFADLDEQGVYSTGDRSPVVAVPSLRQAAELAELDAARVALQQELAQRSAQAETETAAGRAALEGRLAELDARRERLEKSFPRSMVSAAVAPREMRILPRGNWLDHSGPVVTPALPASLAGGEPSARPLTRLDLAEWLVAPENPLVARVFVNRLWMLFFGAGLAKHVDDFGAQGEPPAQPELLDWLAVEFRESGWDVKHLVRLLVTSRAYALSSVPSAEQLAGDPQNRQFARQSRWRLEAEFIRDAALATSGLLVREVGGPSVKPYQPAGYWDFLNFPKRTWRADEGSGQYRRGLYTHWQRTFLHPSLLAFDAPSREECTAQRARSNTPLAALALLNDPSYVECARAFAARILATVPGDDAARIDWAWREATSRAPREAEREVLAELLAENRAHYAIDPAAAEKLLAVGQATSLEAASTESDVAPAERAAWTAVSRAVLNLAETNSRN